MTQRARARAREREREREEQRTICRSNRLAGYGSKCNAASIGTRGYHPQFPKYITRHRVPADDRPQFARFLLVRSRCLASPFSASLARVARMVARSRHFFHSYPTSPSSCD